MAISQWPVLQEGCLTGEREYQAAEADADEYAYLMLRRFMGER